MKLFSGSDLNAPDIYGNDNITQLSNYGIIDRLFYIKLNQNKIKWHYEAIDTIKYKNKKDEVKALELKEEITHKVSKMSENIKEQLSGEIETRYQAKFLEQFKLILYRLQIESIKDEKFDKCLRDLLDIDLEKMIDKLENA